MFEMIIRENANGKFDVKRSVVGQKMHNINCITIILTKKSISGWQTEIKSSFQTYKSILYLHFRVVWTFTH